MAQGKKVFIVGPGFIGWNVLDLLVEDGYTVSALVRRKEAGEDLKKSGAEPIIGGLDDKKLIAEHAFQADIVFHMATADHLPSAEAILEGVKQRASKDLSTIYIHTSGASVFDDKAEGAFKTDKVWYDNKQEEIDSVADSAPHREIDLAIVKAKKELGDKAKIMIMVPPLIYGFNPKHARLSIQIPYLTRFAIKNGHAGHVGKGESVISTINVLDLARAYLTLLHHIEQLPASDAFIKNPYIFCENSGDSEPTWKEIAEAIGEGLHKAERVKDAKPQEIKQDQYDQLFGEFTEAVFGLNTRTRAVRLRELGWKPKEKDWRASYLQDELPQLNMEK